MARSSGETALRMRLSTEHEYDRSRGAPIRIGTCSWADESLTRYFYPPGRQGRRGATALLRRALRHGRGELDLLPPARREMVERWAERTPDGFVMHVKAFGVMTRHPVKVEQLPPDLREGAPVDERGRIDRPPREFRAEIFRRFHEALEPLRETGKLGGILMQFPPYVVVKPASLEYLEWAQEQLGGDEMLVEFRHASWLDGESRAETLAFLERHGMTYVIVDAPQTRRQERPPDGRRDDEPDRVHPLPRPQRRDLEQARPQRGRALRLPLLGGRAGGVGRAAGGALRRRPRTSTRCSTTTAARRSRRRGGRARGGRDRGAGARQRPDAARPARARGPAGDTGSRRRVASRRRWNPGRTSSPAASRSTRSRARC